MSGVVRLPCTWIITGRSATCASRSRGSRSTRLPLSSKCKTFSAGPRVGPHLLGDVSRLDDPEGLHPLGPGPEVVEQDVRPARPRVERPIQERLVGRLADPRPRGAGVEHAPGPRPSPTGRHPRRCRRGVRVSPLNEGDGHPGTEPLQPERKFRPSRGARREVRRRPPDPRDRPLGVARDRRESEDEQGEQDSSRCSDRPAVARPGHAGCPSIGLALPNRGSGPPHAPTSAGLSSLIE